MNQKLYNPKFKEKKTALKKTKERPEIIVIIAVILVLASVGNLLDDAEDRFA